MLSFQFLCRLFPSVLFSFFLFFHQVAAYAFSYGLLVSELCILDASPFLPHPRASTIREMKGPFLPKGALAPCLKDVLLLRHTKAGALGASWSGPCL